MKKYWFVISESYDYYQRRWWHPTPVLLPGKSHGRRSLVGCSPWGRYKSDTTERLHFHVSLSCIGEGNGNPLQCSCLENPRDGGAWWAAVYGVTQSRTQLKRLSSSSSSPHLFLISSASVRSIPFLSFTEPIFAWNVPLVSMIFLKWSLVFPILLFSSISLHWSLKKAFFLISSCYPLNSALRCFYLSFSPLLSPLLFS